jgi:ribosomal protein S18 acetylase RimI-like enzyme
MAIEIRNAMESDIPFLIRIRLLAQGGFNEAVYENLDLSVEDIIATELQDSASTEYFKNYWVALDVGEIAGGILAYPFDDEDLERDHPLLPKERLALEEPFESIGAPGSYYIHAITVFPEYLRRGIGSLLLDLAREHAIAKGIEELSLYVFAENSGAISLYKKHGYKEAGRNPLVPHPKFIYSGDVVLMKCPVQHVT